MAVGRNKEENLKRKITNINLKMKRKKKNSMKFKFKFSYRFSSQINFRSVLKKLYITKKVIKNKTERIIIRALKCWNFDPNELFCLKFIVVKGVPIKSLCLLVVLSIDLATRYV